MAKARTAHANPSCPRCGYDQSGVIATWAEASPPNCPLTGRCSECGLDFLWGDVLNPKLAGPPWSFEHAGHAWARRLLASVRMCLRPRRLWSELRLEHPVRLRRAAAVAALGVLLTYIVTSGLHYGAWSLVAWAYPAKSVWTGTRMSISPFYNFVSQYGGLARSLWPYGHPWGQGLASRVDPWVAQALLAIVIMPLGFAALPDTLRRAKVRKRHLARVWLYSLPAVPLLLYLWVIAHILRDVVPWSWWSPPRGSSRSLFLGELPRRILVPFTIAYLWLWWSAAVRRYMRIPDSKRVVLAMLTIAFLAAAAAVLCVPAWNHDALLGWGY